MADDISDLRLFVRMVAAGSLSETARRLNSSLPAMSRRLAALENRLGARLIDRGPRRFIPTEEGVLFYERGLSILAELDQTEAEVGYRTLAPRGHVRVGAPTEIGRQRIAPLIGEFSDRYPDVTVELLLDDARADVIGNNLDVAIHVDEPSDGDVITRLLWPSRRVVCASPDYLSKHGRPEQPKDLLGHNCIRLVRGRHIYDRWTFSDQGKPLDVKVKGRLSTTSSEIMHQWAVEGRGIALKAFWDLEGDLRDGRLVELLGAFAGNPINLYVIYPTRSHLPNRVRVFIDFMVNALNPPKRSD